MQNLNKKALGEVVSTFALIAITISAVMLAGYNIMNVIESNANIQQSPAFNCLEAQTSLSQQIEITRACINDQKEIEVKVKRTTQNDIDSLTFDFGKETFKCSESCPDCTVLEPNQAKTYYFDFDELEEPSKITLFVNNCELTEAPISQCR